MTGTLTPGEVAARSGFSLDTLRYYERIGLLDRPERSPSGHRRFGEEDLEWLEVLRCLRDTGMPIAQMRRYADEVAVADALVIRALAERGVGDVARMQVGQLADLAVAEGAALALGGGGPPGAPHVKVGDQLAAALEDLQ
jgi:DNA-binding transcriptional MerR regulator